MILDTYFVGSIKSMTRRAREGKVSRKHKLSLEMPLPSQQIILNVSENKQQLIDLIVQELISYVQENPVCRILVVTARDNVPVSVRNGIMQLRAELTTSYL